MTLQQLLESQSALSRLSQQALPAVAAFRLGVFLREIGPTMAAYEAVRGPLIERLGEALPNGGKQVPPQHIQEFVRELAPLVAEQIDVSVPRITVQDLAGLSMSADDMQKLSWLIVDGVN